MSVKKHPEAKLMDIHTHILPGVDDGAQNMQEALSLCRLAWDSGTRAMILTPHYRGIYKPSPEILQAAFCNFQQTLKKELPKMNLYLGCEVRFVDDIQQKFASGKLLCMADSRYVLLEFAPTAFRPQIISGIIQCLSVGKVPIIAHAERYNTFRNDPTLVDDVLKMGAYIQLNADSVMGKHGFFVKRFCHKLLKAEKVHFIASDAHDLKYRPPKLIRCYHRICKKYGETYAKRLFWRNPRAITENKKI